jgi:hypothetical protein
MNRMTDAKSQRSMTKMQEPEPLSWNLELSPLADVFHACDPRELREGTRGSGITRFREESDWPLKWMRSSILARIPGFRQRIIPEPRVPSRGSQARGTRLIRTETSLNIFKCYL